MSKACEPQFMRSNENGFTLIELLVVIAIVLVLAALAATNLTKAQAKAYRAHSISNLKQLQVANQSYASSNNGLYVPAWSYDDNGSQSPAKWKVNDAFLEMYRGPVDTDALGSVKYTMPKALLDPVVVRAKHSRSLRLGKSYGMNITTLPGGKNNTPGSQRKLLVSQLKDPSRTCSFITGQNAFITYSGRYAYNGTENNTGKVTTAYRHEGNAICVFYDGHIELRTKDDMKEIDKDGGSSNLFWKGF